MQEYTVQESYIQKCLCGSTDLERTWTQFHMCECIIARVFYSLNYQQFPAVSRSLCSKQLRSLKKTEVVARPLWSCCLQWHRHDCIWCWYKSLTYHVTPFHPSLTPPHQPAHTLPLSQEETNIVLVEKYWHPGHALFIIYFRRWKHQQLLVTSGFTLLEWWCRWD